MYCKISSFQRETCKPLLSVFNFLNILNIFKMEVRSIARDAGTYHHLHRSRRGQCRGNSLAVVFMTHGKSYTYSQ